mmetsp:Transcript_6914/g.20203  ORF Transcript_6914/g.20203 Transcript_6914/m.20203 type:complete len:215 (-) Transcript_6914:337-981(-)
MCDGLKGRPSPMNFCRDLSEGTDTSVILVAMETQAIPIRGNSTFWFSFTLCTDRNLSRMFTAEKKVESLLSNFWHMSAMQVITFLLWANTSSPPWALILSTSGMNSSCLVLMAFRVSRHSKVEMDRKATPSRGDPLKEAAPMSKSPTELEDRGLSMSSRFSRLTECSEQHKMLSENISCYVSCAGCKVQEKPHARILNVTGDLASTSPRAGSTV